MEPLVSVILPNYNCADYIGSAVQSVLDQTYKNFELIIVNDASTDKSLEIISSFKDERIHLINKEKNGHICLALNEGLEYAKGSYIARIDSDDKWKPEKLEKQIGFLEADKAYGACFTWADIIDGNDNIINKDSDGFYELFKQENRSREEWIRRLFFEGNCLCHPSVVFRSELLKKTGAYRNAMLQLQDYEMWLRLLKYTPIYILEEELTEYRRIKDGGCISAGSDANNVRCYNEQALILSDYLEDMDSGLFISCFKDMFIRSDSFSINELNCEKAFLLYRRTDNMGSRVKGLYKLAKLLDDSEARTLLEKKFNFTSKDFYGLCKEHYYNDPVFIKNIEQYLTTDVFVYFMTDSENERYCSISNKIRIEDGRISCRLVIPDNAVKLRFDPADNKGCIMRNLNISSNGNNLKCKPINGHKIGELWIFDTKDPQISIEVSEGFNGILDIQSEIFCSDSDLFLSFVKDIYNTDKTDYGVMGLLLSRERDIKELENQISGFEHRQKSMEAEADALHEQIDGYKKAVSDKENHIVNIEGIMAVKEQIINDKEQHIKNLEQIIADREQRLARIENSSAWKLYRKIKKV